MMHVTSSQVFLLYAKSIPKSMAKSRKSNKNGPTSLIWFKILGKNSYAEQIELPTGLLCRSQSQLLIC